MRTLTLAAITIALLAGASPALAQKPAIRERARIPMRIGQENMQVEKFEAAARNFQEAIDIEPTFEDAYYWLGRANMAMKKFPEAIAALAKSRDLYQAQAGRQFSNSQEAQRLRRDEIIEIDERIRSLQAGPQTVAVQDQIRQLQDYRRRVQDTISRGNNMTIENTVPAWVSLSLGSAYFRAGKMLDAEREYKVAIQTDPKSGEAHQNLAVVYMTLQRYADAEREIVAAKKTGFKVNPALEEEIRQKRIKS